MNLIKKLEQFQLGLVQPSTFSDIVCSERVKTFRSSLYRKIDVKWDGLQVFVDNGRVSGGYITLDIDKNDNRYLLTGSANGSVEIFDLDPISQTPVQQCSRIAAITRPSSLCHKSHCNWVQWYPTDSGIFVTCSHDKTVKVWDANEMAVVECFHFDLPVNMHDMVQSSASGSSNNLIAVATDESNVRLADVRTGAQSQHLYGNHKGGVICVQWSPYDSNVLLSGGRDGRILAWDIRSGKSFLKQLQEKKASVAPPFPITSLRFTPPTKCLRLVSLTTEGHLRIWDALTLNLVQKADIPFHYTARNVRSLGIDFACHSHLKNQSDVVFIPSGSSIDVVLLSSGQRRQRISSHLLPTFSCAYRGAGYQELYSASCDRTIACYRPEHDENPDYQYSDAGGGNQRSDPLHEDNWSDSD